MHSLNARISAYLDGVASVLDLSGRTALRGVRFAGPQEAIDDAWRVVGAHLTWATAQAHRSLAPGDRERMHAWRRAQLAAGTLDDGAAQHHEDEESAVDTY